MKEYIDIINQLADIEKKIQKTGHIDGYSRNLNRIKQVFETLELSYQIPINEKYTETRTDIEANITGEASDNYKIVDVLKPIIYYKGVVYQKGIVIVEGEK